MKLIGLCAISVLTAFVCGCSKTGEGGGATAQQPPANTQAATFSAETVRLSVKPLVGSGGDQVFTMKVEKASSVPNPTLLGLLINREVTGNQACYVFYDLTANRALLANDSGIGSEGFGSSGMVTNKQCTLVADGTRVTSNGGIAADFHIRFHKAFSGPKKVSLTAQDAAGALVGPVAGGEWTVP